VGARAVGGRREEKGRESSSPTAAAKQQLCQTMTVRAFMCLNPNSHCKSSFYPPRFSLLLESTQVGSAYQDPSTGQRSHALLDEPTTDQTTGKRVRARARRVCVKGWQRIELALR
jgi:hypothetical protein